MYNHICIIRWIKGKIPFGLKILLVRLLVLFEKILYLKFHIVNKDFGSNKKIFILLSTDYSNLGDHAMTYAHKRYLKRNFPEHQIIEILVGDTMKYLFSIRKSLGKDDIITLKGGGNVGVEYFREELIRRTIVTYIKNNKIIMFPQTVYFPDSKLGDKEFQNSIRIYNSNNQFYAFFRDKVSYDIMGPYLKRAFLTPDIVMSLGKIECGVKNKNGALTCLRRDVEGIYTDEQKEIVYKVLGRYYDKIVKTDTIREYKIETADRENELHKMWEQIAEAEILITDRLHGMIFAALIGTPCIILNTYNHKLRAQYEWLKDLNYIELVDLEENNLDIAVKRIKEISVKRMDANKYSDLFNQIQNSMC